MVRAVVQRVRSGSVSVDGSRVAYIGRGLVILLGIRNGDTEAEADRVADKVAVLRIFEDDEGKMNLSAKDIGGAMLVVSQFTLIADVSRGRRPSFAQAADPETGRRLYERVLDRLAAHGYAVEHGRFGADMLVTIENDGPVTLVLDGDAL